MTRASTLLLVAGVSIGLLAAPGALADEPGPASLSRADRSGDVHRGLLPDSGGECGGSVSYISFAGRLASCTHGPDSAPPGLDVTRHRSVGELEAASVETGTATTTTGSSVECYGDGTSGKRVQAVYAVASDRTDRFAAVADLIRGYAGWVGQIVADSAAATGGYRHVKWVTDNCTLDVAHVSLSSSGDDSLSATKSELAGLGYDRTDRKYLVWVDATTYCGIADVTRDDQPSAANENNSGPGYARVDTGCWGQTYSTEAHELMHLLGGVQLSAPHSTGAWHCTDQHDRMCYNDGGSTASPQTYPCGVELLTLFDCGHDDYFHTDPPSDSYLASHWNTASSEFLAADPSGSPASPPITETFSGSLNKQSTSRSFTLEAGDGLVETRLEFSKSKSLRLALRSADGTVVASREGRSVLTQTVSVSTGAYTLVVSLPSGGSTSFTATVTHH